RGASRRKESVEICCPSTLTFIPRGLSMQVVRFRFDGQPINENDTPTSLEMEEGDTIEVYQQQTGGTLV
ncbi:jg8276, partial [Pararge aegeria aegeria]